MRPDKCLIQLLMVCVFSGCDSSEPSISQPQESRQHAELLRTFLTHNRELQAELARLEAEHATPLALNALAPRDHSLTSGESKPSPAAQLDAIFTTATRRSVGKQLAEIWPSGALEFPATTQHVITELLSSNRKRIDNFGRLINNPSFSLTIDHSMGLMMETSFLNSAEIGSQLLSLRASTALTNEQLDDAIVNLEQMLHLATLLGGEKNVALRAAAVHRRREALQVLAAIAQHPLANRLTHRKLDELLAQQLEGWPADRDTWIGDRALGLHTYELIRDGYLLSLLTDDEYRDFDREIGLNQLAAIVGRNIDRDELFYLQAMRDLITVSSKPFHQRLATFRRIDRDLELLSKGESYPFVADRLLLVDIEWMQRLHTVDRARCEAWRFALLLALGETKSTPISPLTGMPFVVEITADQVTVHAIENNASERAATVPFRHETAARPSFQR